MNNFVVRAPYTSRSSFHGISRFWLLYFVRVEHFLTAENGQLWFRSEGVMRERVDRV